MKELHNHDEAHDPEKCAGCTAEMKSVIGSSRFAFTSHPPDRLFVMPDLGTGSVEFGFLDGVLYKRRLGPWSDVDIAAEIGLAEGFLKSVLSSAKNNANLGRTTDEEVDRYAHSIVADRVGQLRALNYKNPRDASPQEIQISITN